MKSVFAAIAMTVLMTVGVSLDAKAAEGCLTCHEGIERFSDGDMQTDIEKFGASFGDAAGCTVCHGGNPAEASD
ncbi:MAG: hypothetical protein ACPGO3_05850 [Magnetospiraceae bacterium]